MGEDEGNRLAGLDRQLTEYFSLVTVKCGRRSQDQTLRTGNRVDRASIESIDPWHGRPVVKTHHKLTTKNHSPRPANHNPHKIGAVCRRHEIDNHRAAGLSLKFGFEDEGAGMISPSHAQRRMLWSNEPPAVVRRPEQEQSTQSNRNVASTTNRLSRRGRLRQHPEIKASC